MRLSALFRLLLLATVFAFSFLLMTGAVSTGSLFDAYQRYTSGVSSQSGAPEHRLTASATTSRMDGYTYAGRLNAKITFTDATGAETAFDLHYPSDYNFFHDGYGPLWLANMRPDISNNPQVSPVMGNSCLQTINGENLARGVRYRTGYKEYLVCRVLDEEGPDAPRAYDISKAKPAVIGVIWANKNHQPIDIPRERCVAEMRIWATEIAKPGDRFMACVFVVSEAPQQVEIFAFEMTKDKIIAVDGSNEAWPRKVVAARDATRLEQYRLIQTWLSDETARDAAVDRAFAHIEARLDQVIPDRISQLNSVARKDRVINFSFGAKSDKEMLRLRQHSSDSADRHLYNHVRRIVCGSDERAALLAFQENAPTYTYDLSRRNGASMTLYAAFSNMPC